MNSFTNCDALAAYQNPYAEDKELFDKAMQEADLWHKQHNKTYAELWQNEQRPTLPVGLFKQLDLSTPVTDEGMWLTSSGTSKTSATKVFFDHESLARIEKAMFGLFIANGIFSTKPSRFLLLSPDPRQGKFPGYATSFFKYTAAAPIQELVFAVNEQGQFDAELAITTLNKWADDEAPIFIFGLTVFFEQLALALTQQINFKGEIKGITGGGWKGLTKTMERQTIIKTLNDKLKAPLVDVRDIFGLTEHPIHYLSCTYGHFHIPIYSHILIVGADGKELSYGEKGLIRLQNPFYASLPAHDILTEDSGSIAANCPCQNPRPYLQYHGRITANEGICAHEASQ